VQDTAYASLLRSRRQRIHADIARALEERFADQIEAAPAIVAHHYTEAGLAEPAARSWLAAAELALSRSAPKEGDRYGDVTGAEAALQEAFVFVEQSGERFWLAELHRLDGQVAHKQPKRDRARAEASLLLAVEIARGQEARMLELRAATDLARLWHDSDSDNDPRALLKPILYSIEGGEATRDVRNARALLAELKHERVG
jgi:hypothetical protein